MSTQFQMRRDTAANLTTANLVYAVGEPIEETDTKKRKTGDGSTAWTALPYDVPSPHATSHMSGNDLVTPAGIGALASSDSRISPLVLSGAGITTSAALQTLLNTTGAGQPNVGKIVVLPGNIIIPVTATITIPTGSGGLSGGTLPCWNTGNAQAEATVLQAAAGMTGPMVTLQGGSRAFLVQGITIDGNNVSTVTHGLYFSTTGVDLEISYTINQVEIRRCPGAGITGRVRTTTFQQVHVFECGIGVDIGTNGFWFDSVWRGGFIAFAKTVGVRIALASGQPPAQLHFSQVRVERTGWASSGTANSTNPLWVTNAPAWSISAAVQCTWSQCSTDANTGPAISVRTTTGNGAAVSGLVFAACTFGRDGAGDQQTNAALAGISVVGVSASGADSTQSVAFYGCTVVPGNANDGGGSPFQTPYYGVEYGNCSQFVFHGQSRSGTTPGHHNLGGLWMCEVFDALSNGYNRTVSLGIGNADNPPDVIGLINGKAQAVGPAASPVTLAYAATVTPNASAGNDHYVAAAGSFTLNPPTSPTNGQTITVEVRASAAITVTISATILRTGALAATASVASGHSAFFGLRYSAPAAAWYLLISAVG